MSRALTLAALITGVVLLLFSAIPDAVAGTLLLVGFSDSAARSFGPRLTLALVFWSLSLLSLGITGLFRDNRLQVAREGYRTAMELVAAEFGARIQEEATRHLGFRCVRGGAEMAVELDLAPDGGVRIHLATPRSVTIDVRAHGVEGERDSGTLIQAARGREWTMHVDTGVDARSMLDDGQVQASVDGLFKLPGVRRLELGGRGALLSGSHVEPPEIGRLVHQAATTMALLASRSQ